MMLSASFDYYRGSCRVGNGVGSRARNVGKNFDPDGHDEDDEDDEDDGDDHDQN